MNDPQPAGLFVSAGDVPRGTSSAAMLFRCGGKEKHALVRVHPSRAVPDRD
ncbi:MAG: hypothetical protein ACE5L7_04905 [Candidatus Aminicenantales bacterium]